jgi:hypothetical protein
MENSVEENAKENAVGEADVEGDKRQVMSDFDEY